MENLDMQTLGVIILAILSIAVLVFAFSKGFKKSDEERQEQLINDLETISDKKDIIFGNDVWSNAGKQASYMRQERDSKGRFVKVK